MISFRDAILEYCEFTAEYDCDRCAFHAACNIANGDARPGGMSERDIDIMFNNALTMYDEMTTVFKAVSGENANSSQHEHS